MPIKRRRLKRRRPTLDNLTREESAYLHDQPFPPGYNGFVLDNLELLGHTNRLHQAGRPPIRELWELHRDQILATWTKDRPGTRPHCWWIFDAPRMQPGPCWYAPSSPEPRERVGGVGTRRYEALNCGASFRYGIPISWLRPAEVEFHCARARAGIDGQPWRWPHRAPDPRDPPRFESQAHYLLRHDLLLPGERQRLRAEHFTPEAIHVAPSPGNVVALDARRR